MSDWLISNGVLDISNESLAIQAEFCDVQGTEVLRLEIEDRTKYDYFGDAPKTTVYLCGRNLEVLLDFLNKKDD